MRGRRVAWSLWALTAALSAVTLVLVALSFGAPLPDNWGFRGYSALVAPVYATAGALIAGSRHRNVVGWLFCFGGLGSAMQGFGQEYATFALILSPGSLPAGEAVAWAGSWTFLLLLATIAFLLLLFPDGRLPGARWRPVGWTFIGLIPVVIVEYALRPGPLENFTGLTNPYGTTGQAELVRSAIEWAVTPVIMAGFVAAAAAPVVRLRRSHGIERLQLKWLTFSAAFVAATLFLNLISFLAEGRATPLGPLGPAGSPAIVKLFQYLNTVALGTVPIACGIAILRYRLYDIDVLINRTLVYGALSAALGLTYVGSILLAQALLRPMTGGSELGVAASTLATLALVQPLRRWIQDAVDRRFYRSRYDAARTLDRLAARLRDEVEIERLRSDVLEAVRETMQPAHAGLWLRRATGPVTISGHPLRTREVR